MDNNELMHYGVLGMKWGVRKARKASSKASKNKSKSSSIDNKESYSEDYKKAHIKKSIKSMSDKELRDRLNRLNMEKQYNQITGASISKGKAYINKIVKALGTTVTVSGAAITLYKNAEQINKIRKAVEAVIKAKRAAK